MSLAYIATRHQQLEWLGGSVMDVLLDSAATEGNAFMARTRLAAGDAAPIHQHTSEDEIFYVLSGTTAFWYGEERHDVSTGGVVYLPRNVPHSYTVIENTDLLTICTPGGVEGFFRAAGHDLAVEKPDGWAITPESLGAAAAATGLQILGPPRPA